MEKKYEDFLNAAADFVKKAREFETESSVGHGLFSMSFSTSGRVLLFYISEFIERSGVENYAVIDRNWKDFKYEIVFEYNGVEFHGYDNRLPEKIDTETVEREVS